MMLLGGLDGAMLTEELAQLVLGRAERKVADLKLCKPWLGAPWRKWGSENVQSGNVSAQCREDI